MAVARLATFGRKVAALVTVASPAMPSQVTPSA